MEMTMFSVIPNEIIEYILLDEKLSHIDVFNFGSTSLRYWNLVNKNNLIWKTKFMQKWPRLLSKDFYECEKVDNWNEEFHQRLFIGGYTMSLVSGMSVKHIRQGEISHAHYGKFDDVLKLSDHKLAVDFAIDELMSCIHHEERYTDLTNKYYSKKVLRYLRQMKLEEWWKKFQNMPADEQLLEHGAVFVAQWSQPEEDISQEAICSQLDDFADKVLAVIRQEFGENHPSLRVDSELRASWRTRNIADNHYTPYVSRQVIETVSKVLFKDLGFFGNEEQYYNHDNSYINKVLENRRGIPITLSILYESVARRVGIKCEPISFPGHFLLRWRDTYKEMSPCQFFYIDVFNGGVFLSRDSCPQFASSGASRCPMGDVFRFQAATPAEVITRMATNLDVAGRQHVAAELNGRLSRRRSVLELMHTVNPRDIHVMAQLAKFYMDHQLDVASLRRTLESMTHIDTRDLGQMQQLLSLIRFYENSHKKENSENTKPLEVKHRDFVTNSPPVKFAVGMIMQHKKFHYTCVIIGWDPVCAAGQDWKIQNRVYTLKRQDRQPFYKVLGNDGSSRYAAEDNLQCETRPEEGWIPHCEVGKYFNSFWGTHYQMNQVMLQAYPDDPEMLGIYFNLK